MFNKGFHEHMPRPAICNKFLEPSDVLITAKFLKVKWATVMMASTKILKDTIPIITEPIAYTINKPFDTDIVPKEMKTTKVVPIH